MALDLGKNKFLTVIDRTLPEIQRFNKKASRLSMVSFCWMLKEIGVDFIEIDADVLEKIKKMPSEVDFIYRLQSMEDVKTVFNQQIRNCVFGEDLLKKAELIPELNENNINTILEISADRAEAICELIRERKLLGINQIRLIKIKHLNVLPHLKSLMKICKDSGILVDICPDNSLYFATAIAANAIMDGIDGVTCSFSGFGVEHRYAALEEVLMSVKVLVNANCSLDLKILPQLSKLITEMTGLAIADNKPVLGTNIFRYESGIHADGIEKNPTTYEPFEPSFVGQCRSLAIGKHSGKNSIVTKLHELEMPFEIEDIPKILVKVRKKSISLRRDLTDGEIKKISEEFYECAYRGYDARGW